MNLALFYDDRIGAHIAQTIGTRVFKALNEYVLGKRGLPRFKGVKRPLHGIEGKNIATMLRWDADARFLVLSPAGGIPVDDKTL